MTLRWKVYGALALLVAGYLTVTQWRLDRADAREEQRFVDVLRRARFVQGVKSSQAQIEEALPPKLAEAVKQIKKEAPDAKVTAHLETEIAVADTIPGIPGTYTPIAGKPPAEAPLSGSWDDEYHRFHLSLPNGPLTRHQSFKYDAVILRRLSGQYQFTHSEFREFDPVTKEEIPNTGVEPVGHFQFYEEERPAAKPFHPIAVVAADLSGFGAGVEFARWKQLSVTALGFYDYSNKSVRGAVQLGWRLKFPAFDSNIVLGASYSTDLRIRPSTTFQVTR